MNGGGRDDLSFILSVGRSEPRREGGRERLLLTRPLLRPQRARARAPDDDPRGPRPRPPAAAEEGLNRLSFLKKRTAERE